MFLYRPAFLLWGLFILGLPNNLSASPREELLVLQAELSLTPTLLLLQEPLLSPSVLARYYHRNRYHPAWRDPSEIKAMMQRIRESGQHGLIPADYHYEALQRVIDQHPVRTLHDWPDKIRAQFDHLLTDALVTYWTHRRWGRQAGMAAGTDTNRHALVNDRWIDTVQMHLDAGTLSQLLNQWLQPSPDYRRAQQILVALRKKSLKRPSLGKVPLLRPWDSHEKVPVLKQRLVELGYLDSAGRSRIFDRRMIEALKRFQRDSGLQPDAIVGQTTLKALESPEQRHIDALIRYLERLRWAESYPDRVELHFPAGITRLYRENTRQWQGDGQWLGTRPGRQYKVPGQLILLTFNPGSKSSEQSPGSKPDPSFLAGIQAGKPMAIFAGQWKGPRKLTRLKLLQPIPFVQKLLTPQGEWSQLSLKRALSTGIEQHVPLKRPMPVLFRYHTLQWHDDGSYSLNEDVLARDQQLDRALSQALF